MNTTTIALTLAAVVASTIAQAMLKHGMDNVGGIAPPGSQFLASMQKVATEPFILGGFLLILLAVPVWLEVLSRLPLSIAYPMVSIGYVLSVGIGAVILKEAVTPMRIVAVVLILLGVIVLSRS